MGIQVDCTNCGRRLEVDEQYAGSSAVCPVCHTSFQVPTPGEQDAETEPANWHMKTPEGRSYGPVTKTELDRWVSEGRVSNDCELRDGDERWRQADDVYAVLKPTVAASPKRGNPFGPAPFYSVSGAPAGPPSTEPGSAPKPYVAAHRGGLVLALGILAFLVACPVLSFMAWTMGTNDLREMREGRMDPSGMGMTQAGMVLGMLLSVATIVTIMGLVFYLLFRMAI